METELIKELTNLDNKIHITPLQVSMWLDGKEDLLPVDIKNELDNRMFYMLTALNVIQEKGKISNEHTN